MRTTTMLFFIPCFIFFGGAGCTFDLRCDPGSDADCGGDDDADGDDDDDDTADGDDDTSDDVTAAALCDGPSEYLVRCTAPSGTAQLRSCGNFMAGTDDADQHWLCTEWQQGNVFTWCGTVLAPRLDVAAGCPGNQCGLEFSVEVGDSNNWLCTNTPSNQMHLACTADGPTPVEVQDVTNGRSGCHGHLSSMPPQ